MSVDTLHIDYDNFTRKWKYCRDVIGGDDAVKKGRELYIPRLSGQDDTEYNAMINRPVLEEYSQRTKDGLSGLMFSKPATYEVPKSLEALFTNIDLDNNTLTDLTEESVDEVLEVGRVGLLVDMAAVDTAGMTVLEVQSLNLRPYVKKYNTENIINWKHETINNKQVLSMVVLSESKDVWTDEFTRDTDIAYRVLTLEDGIYRVRVFEMSDGESGSDGWVVTFESFPKMNGKNMNEIPFVAIGTTSLSITPTKPPLYGLCKVNLTHFKTNVDYYHGMHFTALPTPYISGHQTSKDEEIKIGSTSFHVFSDPSAKMAYLEFEGKGLETLENEKTSLKETMVILGSNMLQGDKNSAEAENTVAMRNAGQNASLTSISNTVSRGIEKALTYMSLWLNDTSAITYSLNTDYNLTEMDAQKILALNTVQLSGNLTKQEVFNAYKKGEIIEESKTFEEHQTQLKEETPSMSVLPLTKE